MHSRITSRIRVAGTAAAFAALGLALPLIPATTAHASAGQYAANSAQAGRCKYERSPNDGDAGGVSGRVSVWSSNGEQILHVRFRAYNEKLYASRPLKSNEDVLLTSMLNGAALGALFPGQQRKNLSIGENHALNLNVRMGDTLCQLPRLVS